MSKPIILVQPTLAQAQGANESPLPDIAADKLWMGASGALLLLLIGSLVFSKVQLDKLNKKIKFDEFKNRELQKKLKMALETITKMEKNPDLLHSREFNLDYLRMRMEEENFHFAIVNQIKVKVKEKISVALRPNAENRGTGRQVDEIFDVDYQIGEIAKSGRRVLFRIQIKLTKLPTQATSKTISQIIDCLETYLSARDDHDTWQPTIQGRVAYIHWDQKAKPTPLLVLEQSNEGVNVTFRTTTTRRASTANQSQKATAGQMTSMTNMTTRRTKTTGKTRTSRGSRTSGGSKSRRSR
ncbi:hypothetical protein [Phormidium sp. CCY1219]|jgi:hypothetical protein|uniref:hypothetical protein n=1 Tax=Phormidium sp. CCY1219 TaxID=2886104 RepID=UPI002D1E7FCC|nr:hypothetical protein [Phormidium sp. CCY1219]MEB3826385.1 hypothetical protein [Phormidium sp. CCY1219]